MELSIIIVHHRTPEILKLCLKSIGAALILGHRKSDGTCDVGGLEPEIIIIDSMSSRQSRGVVYEFRNQHDDIESRQKPTCDVKFLPFNYNLGFSRGVNIGLKNSSGKYILILNPDVIIPEGTIEKMLEYIKTRPDIGMLGPRVLNFNGTHQQTYFSYYKPATILARRTFLGLFASCKKVLNDFVMSDTDPKEIQAPDWLMGSVIMVRHEAIEKVGPMDERFFMYFEDVDWARRFWHNDYKVIYFPEAVVYHYHQRESKSKLGMLDVLFNRKTRWHIASAVKFFWKYRDLKKINS